MKSHISATIEQGLLERVDQYRRSVRRSRSQIIELAIEKLLKDQQALHDKLVTSQGTYAGEFSREDTYADR